MAEDKIIKKLLEHDDEFEKTRGELKIFRDDVLSGQDRMMVILQRLDQERVFTNETIKRLEMSIKTQETEINKIKKLLKV